MADLVMLSLNHPLESNVTKLKDLAYFIVSPPNEQGCCTIGTVDQPHLCIGFWLLPEAEARDRANLMNTGFYFGVEKAIAHCRTLLDAT